MKPCTNAMAQTKAGHLSAFAQQRELSPDAKPSHVSKPARANPDRRVRIPSVVRERAPLLPGNRHRSSGPSPAPSPSSGPRTKHLKSEVITSLFSQRKLFIEKLPAIARFNP
jgi:hypothetical protein